MKMITAIIKPFKLDDLQEALGNIDVSGMTISEVKGFGKQRGQTDFYEGSEFLVDFLPRIKVEIVVDSDKKAQEIVDKIIEIVHTGQKGDGKIFIHTLDDAIRISNKTRGKDSII
jgi:nitrogen regulatory protein PII